MGSDRSLYSLDPHKVMVGHLECRAGFQTAAVWVPALSSGRPERLLMSTVEPESRAHIALALADGTVTIDDVQTGLFDLIQDATGMSWWKTLRLCAASEQTEIAGELALRGMDPERVGIGVWCAAVYALLVRNKKPDDVFKLDAQLDVPPPGYEAWDDGTDFDMMVQAARSLPGMG